MTAIAARVSGDGPDYQALIAAPGFCLGVRCDDDEVQRIVFLLPSPEVAPKNALAAETVLWASGVILTVTSAVGAWLSTMS